jgi:8-oxo-dGTP pyrophosphatase MutT (NUDIX family)
MDEPNKDENFRKPIDEKQRQKQSYGLAVCKFINNRFHVLFVKKKYTYSFFEFVFGKYPKFDKKKLEELFNTMTFQEKLLILEMNFDKLWCKIVLNVPEDPNVLNKNRVKLKRPTGKKRFELAFTEGLIGDINENEMLSAKEKEFQTYISKKNRFTELIEDGGKLLKELIAHSSSSDAIWEIPKGRPDENEKPLDAAMREFTEETNGIAKNYKIIHEIEPIKVNYINNNCLYNNDYFVAIVDPNWEPTDLFHYYENNREIEEVRWINTDEIRFLNRNQHTYARMIELMNRIKKAIKAYKPKIELANY